MRIGLALGGGGARGLAHIGILEVLEREGVSFDVLSGTSMGAIIGAFYVQEKNIPRVYEKVDALVKSDIVQELERKFGSLTVGDLTFVKAFSLIKEFCNWNLSALRRGWVIDYAPFEALFREAFQEKTFQDFNIPFTCVATDLVGGNEVYLRSGPLWRALLASMSLPGIFPPLQDEGKLLVDGGILESIPVMAVKRESDFVIGVNVERRRHIPGKSTNLSLLLSASEVRHYKIIQLLEKEADFIFAPAVEEYDWSDFSKIDEIVECGRREAEEKVGMLKRTLRKSSVLFPFKKVLQAVSLR